MTENVSTTPTPPRATGNIQADIQAIISWGYDLYRALVVEQRLADRLNAIAAIATSTTVISNPPTKANVEELQTKINAIIAAVQAPVSA